MTTPQKHLLLKRLPGVDSILNLAGNSKRFLDIPPAVIKSAIRQTLERIRQSIINGNDETVSMDAILKQCLNQAKKTMKPNLVPLINATGVVLHTNLGRALLSDAALTSIQTIATAYSNLEFNIKEGTRGLRYSAVEKLICDLTGAQAAMAVNNNAGAVLLCLDTLASGKEVIVSRGELVEIGGSFRIPDVMAKSGGILKEVGTTNRTHLRDYEMAASDTTGLFLKVHTSNYHIEGFTATVALKELVSLGEGKNIPVMEDLGSGSLIDLSAYGLAREPTITEAVASGADVITFSGDKLLGGPQAGIIIGKKEVLEKIRKNPLTRALRIDKLTLASLEATLRLYRDIPQALKRIPTLRMLTQTFEETAKRAHLMEKELTKKLGDVALVKTKNLASKTGGGSLPGSNLPSRCIAIKAQTMSSASLEKKMRSHHPAVIGRIEDDHFILDLRTVQEGQEEIISNALTTILIKKDN